MNTQQKTQPELTAPSPVAWSSFFEFIKSVVLVLLVAFLIRHFLIQPFVVDGQSMEPNFENGEYILVDKVSYLTHSPNRGEVIVFNPPLQTDNYIKRVIGVPGDTVEVRGHQVYVNNKLISEPYLDPSLNTSTDSQADVPVITQTIPANEYFVLGDNRDHSKDSREIGLIPRERIIGRAWVVLFPVNKVKSIQTPTYSNLAFNLMSKTSKLAQLL